MIVHYLDAVKPRYFKRRCEESRGDWCDSWGTAAYFFETDQSLVPVRQVEVYDGGQRLCYGRGLVEDEYGRLGEGRVFAGTVDESDFEITASEFEEAWRIGREVEPT